MRFECRICVLRLAFHVFIQIRYEHPHQNADLTVILRSNQRKFDNFVTGGMAS